MSNLHSSKTTLVMNEINNAFYRCNMFIFPNAYTDKLSKQGEEGKELLHVGSKVYQHNGE